MIYVVLCADTLGILDPPPTTHSVERPLASPSPPHSPPHNILPISSPLQTTISLDNVPSSHNPPQRPEVSPTHHPPLPFRSGILSPTRACSVASLPVGSSFGSMDWPPIGSKLRPSGKNAEQDSGIRLLVSETPSSQRVILTNRFTVTQKTLCIPLREADDMPSTSATSRNPLNLPLPQIMISRELTAGRLGFSKDSHLLSRLRTLDIPQSDSSFWSLW